MDPFPNTADATLEQRLGVLFQGRSAILVVPNDPLELRNGLLWFNTTDRKLKLHNEGVTWTIGEASVNG